MITIKRLLPLLTIFMAALMFAQQYIFFLKVPLTVFTPIVGLFGIIFAIKLEKGAYKTGALIVNSIVMCIFPLYLVLTFIFPEIFV